MIIQTNGGLVVIDGIEYGAGQAETLASRIVGAAQEARENPVFRFVSAYGRKTTVKTEGGLVNIAGESGFPFDCNFDRATALKAAEAIRSLALGLPA